MCRRESSCREQSRKKAAKVALVKLSDWPASQPPRARGAGRCAKHGRWLGRRPIGELDQSHFGSLLSTLFSTAAFSSTHYISFHSQTLPTFQPCQNKTGRVIFILCRAVALICRNNTPRFVAFNLASSMRLPFPFGHSYTQTMFE